MEYNYKLEFPGLCVMSIIIISANFVIILAILLERRVRRIRNNIFLISMAISDLLIGAVVLPLDLVSNFKDEWCSPGTRCCKLLVYTHMFLCSSFNAHLCLCCFDRYKSLSGLIAYRAWVNRKKSIRFIALAWSVPVCTTTSAILYDNLEQTINLSLEKTLTGSSLAYMCFVDLSETSAFVFCMVSIWPCFFVALFLAKIYMYDNSYEIKRHISYDSASGIHQVVRNKRLFLLGSSTVAFLVCWFPFMVVWVRLERDQIPHYVLRICYLLTLFKSLINPIIFFIGQNTLRAAVIKVMSCYKCGEYKVTIVEPGQMKRLSIISYDMSTYSGSRDKGNVSRGSSSSSIHSLNYPLPRSQRRRITTLSHPKITFE